MTTPLATATVIDRRARQMFEEDSRDLSYPIEWARLDEHLREAYRASARVELATVKRVEVVR